MTPKIGLIIVHGFMNATIKNYGYDQWSLTVNVHSFIYEHRSCMINDHRHRYEHQSCMINDHRFSHEHWSSMIIDHEHNYSWSMIVAMKCYWSYMISVDQWVISWSLGVLGVLFITKNVQIWVFILWINFPKSSPFRVLCGKRYASLKKVHHPRLWGLWQLSGV